MIIENQNYLLRNTIASIKFIFRTKLGFFLVRSSLLRAVSPYWPKCSGTTT